MKILILITTVLLSLFANASFANNCEQVKAIAFDSVQMREKNEPISSALIKHKGAISNQIVAEAYQLRLKPTFAQLSRTVKAMGSRHYEEEKRTLELIEMENESTATAFVNKWFARCLTSM